VLNVLGVRTEMVGMKLEEEEGEGEGGAMPAMEAIMLARPGEDEDDEDIAALFAADWVAATGITGIVSVETTPPGSCTIIADGAAVTTSFPTVMGVPPMVTVCEPIRMEEAPGVAVTAIEPIVPITTGWPGETEAPDIGFTTAVGLGPTVGRRYVETTPEGYATIKALEPRVATSFEPVIVIGGPPAVIV
jgi:hypothetical protein